MMNKKPSPGKTNQRSSISTHKSSLQHGKAVRVSPFFAKGFAAAENGQPASSLNHATAQTQWQRNELHAGYAAFVEGRGKSCHIQSWLVEGKYTHGPEGPEEKGQSSKGTKK